MASVTGGSISINPNCGLNCKVQSKPSEPIPVGGHPGMGYGRLWVIRGKFWSKFQFGSTQNPSVMGVYGLLDVWVKRGSTVIA